MTGQEEMDRAAAQAAAELQEMDPECLKQMVRWWSRWYRQAGHRRLGRELARIAREQFPQT